MKRPGEAISHARSAVRERFVQVTSQSERSLLLGTILLASAVSAMMGFVLLQYYSVDALFR